MTLLLADTFLQTIGLEGLILLALGLQILTLLATLNNRK